MCLLIAKKSADAIRQMSAIAINSYYNININIIHKNTTKYVVKIRVEICA